MSTDSAAHETPPLFPAELLATALAEMRQRPADERLAELANMRGTAQSLVLVHQEFDGYKERDKAHQTSAGYLLGHRVLRYAVEEPLHQYPLKTLLSYLQLVSANPHRLESDFARDYAEHEAVLAMVNDDLLFEPSRFGARFMFAIYGRLANPGRPSMHIPSAQTGGSQRTTARREHMQRHRGR